MSFQREFRISVFLAGIWQKLLPFSKSVPSNFSICEVSSKNKENTYNCDKKMLYFDILGLEFEKAIAISEINALEFVKMQSLVQNKNP